jgi:hypothetical protein
MVANNGSRVRRVPSPLRFLLSLAFGLHPALSPASTAFTISTPDKKPCPIVIASDAPPSERYAAQELQRCIGELGDGSLQRRRAKFRRRPPVVLAKIVGELQEIASVAIIRRSASDTYL